MDIQTLVRAVEWVAVALGWLSVPLLGVAAVVHLRRSATEELPPVSGRARLAQALVAALVTAGVTAAVVHDVPLSYGWGAVAAVAIMAFLLRRDERFWAALVVLLPLFTVIGALILVALAHNFASASDQGLWYGGRQLVAWGGLHANPTYGGWEWTVVALAVVRYGLPLSLVLTTSWLVSVRGSMTRVERLGLVTASESLFVTVFIGATFSIVVLGAGMLQGLPVPLALAGVVGSVFTLVTVGPGAFAGILVGGRTLVSRVPTAAAGAATLVSSLTDAREVDVVDQDDARASEPDSVWRSFLQFVSGDISTVKLWNLRLLGLFGVLVALGMLGTGLSQRVEDSEAVHFEYIAEEIGVGFEAATTIRPGGRDDLWLLGEDGAVAHFDLAAGDLTSTDLRAWSLAEDGDSALALTREEPPRVVRLDPTDPDAVEEVVTLAGRARGLLAVDGRRVYVASGDGRLTRYDGASGEVAVRVDPGPVSLLSADEGALWTVHPNRAEDFGSPRVVRRNPDTLAPSGGAGTGGTPGDPRVVVALLGGLSGLTDDDDVRLLPSVDPQVHWRTEGLGELERLGADGDEQRFDVHYDSVYGVFETDGGTWLLVQDDQGTIVDVSEVDESRLALWEAWPAG